MLKFVSMRIKKGCSVLDTDLNPILSKEAIFEGKYVKLQTLWGLSQAVITIFDGKLFAETEGSRFYLDFEEGDGWYSSFGYNKALLDSAK